VFNLHTGLQGKVTHSLSTGWQGPLAQTEMETSQTLQHKSYQKLEHYTCHVIVLNSIDIVSKIHE
jgi:hypothetical protein